MPSILSWRPSSELDFQILCLSSFFIASNALLLSFSSVLFEEPSISPTIPSSTFQFPLTVFLTLTYLHATSFLWATNRLGKDLALVSLAQSLISTCFYSLELNLVAPEVISVYGRRVSPLRHVYWMSSISFLFIIGNSSHGPLGSSRLRRQLFDIALMLITGYAWQLHANVLFQIVNFGLSMFGWFRLLDAMRSNMETARNKFKSNTELSSPYDYLRFFAMAYWISYPVINLLGFTGILSQKSEELCLVCADLFSKLISAAMIQSGLMHVASIKHAQGISQMMMSTKRSEKTRAYVPNAAFTSGAPVGKSPQSLNPQAQSGSDSASIDDTSFESDTSKQRKHSQHTPVQSQHIRDTSKKVSFNAIATMSTPSFDSSAEMGGSK